MTNGVVPPKAGRREWIRSCAWIGTFGALVLAAFVWLDLRSRSPEHPAVG